MTGCAYYSIQNLFQVIQFFFLQNLHFLLVEILKFGLV